MDTSATSQPLKKILSDVLPMHQGVLRAKMPHYDNGQYPLPFGEQPETPHRQQRHVVLADFFEYIVCGWYDGKRGDTLPVPVLSNDGIQAWYNFCPDVVVRNKRGLVTQIHEVKAIRETKSTNIYERQWEGMNALQRELPETQFSIVFPRHAFKGSRSKETQHLSDEQMYTQLSQHIIYAIEFPLSVFRWMVEGPRSSQFFSTYEGKGQTPPYLRVLSSTLDRILLDPQGEIPIGSDDLPRVDVERTWSPARATVLGVKVKRFPVLRFKERRQYAGSKMAFGHWRSSSSFASATEAYDPRSEGCSDSDIPDETPPPTQAYRTNIAPEEADNSDLPF